MPHVRAICQAVIDHPHADGIILDGGFGLLQQFRFLDHFEVHPGDLSRHPAPEWDLSSEGHYNVEIIPELRAAGPRGICGRADMTLYDPQTNTGNWERTNHQGLPNCSNLWKEVYPVGHPRAKCLFFYDARGAYDVNVGYFGEVTSRYDWPHEPNFVLRAYRYAPSPSLPNAGYCYLELQLLGDSQAGQWSLVLPVAGTEGQARYPRLGWRLMAEDDWQVLREFRTAPHEVAALRGKPFEQVVTWETIDRHIRLNIDGRTLVYWVPPNLQEPNSPLIAAGPMRIIVYGHAAMVNLTPICYPDGFQAPCVVQRASYFPVDNTIFSPEPTFDVIAWEPPGTAALPGASVTTVGNEDRWVPKVSFTSASPYHRAIVYLHEMDFAPTISAGESDPYETQGNDVVVSANGVLTNSWREARCRVVLDLDQDAVGDLPNWKGNNKITVSAGWDDGCLSDIATQFTGYLIGSAHVREGERPGRVSVVLKARDGFVRLERKYWQHLGTFEGWTLQEAFHRVLNQCGIPDENISFTGDSELVIPYGERLADLRFDFDQDTPVPEGLDRLVQSCGYTWGVNQEGVWFCRPPVAYSGTPDFTLHDDTLNADDVAFALRSENVRGEGDPKQGFANAVFVRIDRGAEQDVAWRRNVASHQDPAADDFIGDDWWFVFVGYDEPSAAALAERILAERRQRQKMLYFRCSGKPALFPDHFVRVQATGVGMPSGSVFQIVRKRWSASQDGEFVTEFACKWVGSE